MIHPSSPGRSATPIRRWLAAAVLASLPLAGVGSVLSAAQADPGDPPGTIRTIAGTNRSFAQGGFYGDNGPAAQASLYDPRAFTFAPNGDLYFTDSLNERIRRIDPQGIITTFAGNPVPDANGNPTPCDYSKNNCGDGGQASQAGFNQPHGIAIDSQGNVYISDSQNNRIRKVDTSGVITTFAGTGQKQTPAGANVPVLQAGIQDPKQMMIVNDVMYVCDTAHNMIRSIDLKATPLIVKNVAGTIQSKHFGGDGGPASSAELNSPKGMFIEPDGTILVSDTDNNLIRRITPDGIIRTIAGDVAAAQAGPPAGSNSSTLKGDSSGDGGPAINAHLNGPRGIIADAAGNIYIAETQGARIRRIDPQGNIDTIAGTGVANGRGPVIGDPGPSPALQAQFNWPHDLLLKDGNLYLADQKDNRLRVIFDAADAPGASAGGGTPAQGQPGSPGAPGSPGHATGGNGKSGYWMLGQDGKVYAFGDARSLGDPSAVLPAGARAVHIEPTPSAVGYWIVDDAGDVYAYGDAVAAGGVTPAQLGAGEKVTSLSPTPSGKGYWIFTTKGRVFTFGDAKSFGDMAGKALNGAVRSSVATPSGNGYYMVASDGGVFAFGDATFRGSMGARRLNQPVESLVPTRDGGGYWLVASDGGIFAFGDAPFRGSMGATHLNKPVVGMVRYGDGYLMVGADGGIFDFSDTPFSGSLGGNPPAHPIVFAATLDS